MTRLLHLYQVGYRVFERDRKIIPGLHQRVKHTNDNSSKRYTETTCVNKALKRNNYQYIIFFATFKNRDTDGLKKRFKKLF